MRIVPAVIFFLFFICNLQADATLIAHWRLDEKSGTTAEDDVGGRDGTLYNFSESDWRKGKVGGALYFNGYTSFVKHGFTLDRERGTLMHWVKPDAYSGRGMLYYESDMGNPAHDPTDYNGFNAGGEALEIHTAWKGDDREFCFYYQDGPEAVNECDDEHLIANGWNHVAVTWDINGEMIIYLNCQRSGSEDLSDAIFRNYATSQDHGFFGRPSDNERFFAGLLDDVRIYDDVLTPDEFGDICEEGEFQSSVMARDHSLLSSQFAGQFCGGLAQHGTYNVKNVVLLMQTPFGGGFLDAIQSEFGSNGPCGEVPWVAASASGALSSSRGWSDLEVNMNTVNLLGSTWTQAIAGPSGNIGGVSGTIFNGSATNNVLQDLQNAREIDIAGPKGKGTETPLIITGNGGDEVQWTGEGAKHEALLFNSWGDALRNENNLSNMRSALEQTWQGEAYNISTFSTANSDTDDLLDTLSMAIQRLDPETQLLVYFTGLGDSTADLSGHACGLTGNAITNDKSCCINLPPAWYKGLLGNHRAGAEYGLTFELDIVSCEDCASWAYTFNNRTVQLETDMIPGFGKLQFAPWELRPGRNCLGIGTGHDPVLELSGEPKTSSGHSSMQLSGIRLTTGPLKELQVNHDLKPGLSGGFFDIDRNGEGIFLELLDSDRALIYMFTYSADKTGRQAWMIGVGEIIGNNIVVTEMYRPTGPRFGPGFDPKDRILNPFGGMAFVTPTCGTDEPNGLLFMSPPVDSEYENMWSENYGTLTSIVDCDQAQGHVNAGYSGSWFDKSHDGEGFILEVLPDGRVLVQWFTYDFNGDQMWVQGVGKMDGDTLTVDSLYTVTGPTWGSLFDTTAVVIEDWGSMVMEWHDCNSATATYDSTVGFGSGTFDLIRLTSLLGIPCE